MGPGRAKGKRMAGSRHTRGQWMSAHHPGCIWHAHDLRHEIRTDGCMCGRLEKALQEARHLARELVEVLEERNRARDIAVALEQEIAACPVIEHRPIRG